MAAGRPTSRWMLVVERLLFTIAAVALIWYAGVRLAAAREQAAMSNELDHSRAALVVFTASTPDPARTAAPRTPAPAPSGLVGRLEIPRLKLSVLVREGVDTHTLRESAGHLPGSPMPGDTGNAAFAAHRDTFFRPLKNVRAGDEITLATPAGDFHYVVSATSIVEPSDVSVLRSTSEATLTLITCYPFYYVGSAPQRFIVSARLVPR